MVHLVTLCGGLLLGVGAPSAEAARVTELLTAPQDGPGGRYPAYVELHYGTARGPFDLAVLAASPGRSARVKQMVRVQPRAGGELAVIHEGDWPVDSAGLVQRVAVPEGGLGFGQGAFGTAVRLVVFDGPAKHAATGEPFSAGRRLPGMDAWPAELSVTDSVAVSLDGGAVAPVDDDHAALEAAATLELDHGDAAFRWHDGSEYLDRFATGPLDGRLSLDGGVTMNPGRANDWPAGGVPHLPTPGAAAMGLTLLAGAGLLGRGRPRRRAG